MRVFQCSMALLALGATVAEAHYGQRVWVDVDASGAIQTFKGPPGDSPRPYQPSQFTPSRVFTRDMGDRGDITPGVSDGGSDDDGVNYATQFPGYEATPFKSTDFRGTFQLDIVGEARYFQSAAGNMPAQFAAVSQVFHGSATPYFTVGDSQTFGTSPTGFSIVPACTGFTAGSHNHPENVLNYAGGPNDGNDGYDGVYALGLRLRQGSAASKYFYLVLGKNAPLSQLQSADAAANLRMNRTPGDVNCDGKVDVVDLGILATRWQQSDTSWFSADFNDDGRVDVVDLGLLASHWQAGVSFAAAVQQTNFVPEPATLCALAGLVLLGTRFRSAKKPGNFAMKNVCAVAAVLTLGVTTRGAFAHGPVIPLTRSGSNSIATYQLDLDAADANGYTPSLAARSFQTIPMSYQASTAYPSDNGFYGQLEAAQPTTGEDTTFLGPGLAFGQGGFSSTTVFRVTFTDVAKVWQPDNSAAGGSFMGTGGETIQGIRGNFSTAGFANTLRSDGVQSGTGILTGAVGTNNPGNHSQIRWRLDGPSGSPLPSTANAIDDGLYLASLQVGAYEGTAATSAYATSSSYYLMFEKNQNGGVSTADERNAQAALSAIAPEPAGLTVVAAVALLGRRTRKGAIHA